MNKLSSSREGLVFFWKQEKLVFCQLKNMRPEPHQERIKTTSFVFRDASPVTFGILLFSTFWFSSDGNGKVAEAIGSIRFNPFFNFRDLQSTHDRERCGSLLIDRDASSICAFAGSAELDLMTNRRDLQLTISIPGLVIPR
jgi:hypothetical protein